MGQQSLVVIGVDWLTAVAPRMCQEGQWSVHELSYRLLPLLPKKLLASSALHL